jgi:hypothetical protein
MQATLRQFIDPANLPKKFGGELDFEFGGMPVLDPAYDEHITWENGYKDFPLGPLYWHDRGDYIELEAVGSVDGKERREMVCKMRKPSLTQVLTEKQNGNTARGLAAQMTELRPDFLSAPTEQEVPLATGDSKAMNGNGEAIESKVVQAGEVVPASRPEPVTFVTAQEGIKTLSLENDTAKENIGNGTNDPSNPHVTATANALDPNIPRNHTNASEHHKSPKVSLESAHGLTKTTSKGTTRSTAKSHKSQGSVSGLKDKILHKLKH